MKGPMVTMALLVLPEPLEKWVLEVFLERAAIQGRLAHQASRGPKAHQVRRVISEPLDNQDLLGMLVL